MTPPMRFALLGILIIVPTTTGLMQSRERSATPEKYTWNLADLFSSINAWTAAKNELAGQQEAIRQFKGRLATSPAVLADALELRSRLEQRIVKLGVYAGLLGDQDTRIPSHQGMGQEMQQLGAKFSAEFAFIEPEILRIDAATLDTFVAQEPRLKPYAFYLRG